MPASSSGLLNVSPVTAVPMTVMSVEPVAP